MAKANKKAKAAAPKKAAKGAKAAAPKKAAKGAAPKGAAPKKAASKTAAPKKGFKGAAPKKAAGKTAAPKKGFKGAAPKKAAAKKATAKKATAKKTSRGGSPSTDQRPMLEALFIDHLKDIYFAEKHLTKALPKMARAATSPELKQAFEEHLQVTNQQVSRLDQVFQIVGKKAQGKKCEAMVGLVTEAESVIQSTEKGSKTRDVGLIIAAQKVEHYEIASYGGMATLARTLGLEEAKNLLGQTLDEEKQTDELLTQLAENNINEQAEQEGGSEETEDDDDEDGAEGTGIKLDAEEEKEEGGSSAGS